MQTRILIGCFSYLTLGIVSVQVLLNKQRRVRNLHFSISRAIFSTSLSLSFENCNASLSISPFFFYTGC